MSVTHRFGHNNQGYRQQQRMICKKQHFLSNSDMYSILKCLLDTANVHNESVHGGVHISELFRINSRNLYFVIAPAFILSNCTKSLDTHSCEPKLTAHILLNSQQMARKI